MSEAKIKCPECDGVGKVKDGMGEATTWFTCGVCHGAGKVTKKLSEGETTFKKFPYGKIYGKYGDIWAKDTAEKLKKLLEHKPIGWSTCNGILEDLLEALKGE